MSRWRAGVIHLLISAVVAAAAIGLTMFSMYPSPYGKAAGAQTLLVLIVGVDIVLGPLITTFIFKSGKRGLKFDLLVIALLQVGALVYGIWTLVNARPVFVAHNNDRFVVVPANALEDEALAAAAPPFNRRSWSGPVLVGTQLPADLDEQQLIMMSAISGGADVEFMPKHYVPYAKAKEEVARKSKPLRDLLDRDPEATAAVTAWLDGRDVDGFRFMPLKGQGFFTLILGATSVEPVDLLDVDPWES